MLSKRFALIVGGTIGGLGAVLSITPPQFGNAGGLASGGSLSGASLSGSSLSSSSSAASATTAPAAATPVPAATAATTTTSTTKKKKKSSTTSSKTTTTTTTTNSAASTTSANSTTQSAAPVASSSTTSKSTISGTFTGNAASTIYGPVQVQIAISNGKITNVTAPIYPVSNPRDQSINAQAIPWLEQQTIAAQSANIQGVGGASYTSEGFYQSLVSALSKAGM